MTADAPPDYKRPPATSGRDVLFSVTLFLSAALLFWVQPLVGKMLLPLLGGTPSVWNTCLLFFQAALLGGYAYALASTRWLAWRWQVALHALLFAAAALALPLAVSVGGAVGEAPGEAESPAGWLLKRLLLTVGPPFFVLSSTAPLLQKWFTRTRAASASDPYFLYAASNAGSLAALLGFPLLLEPSWPLGVQGRAWSLGYGGLAVLLLACAYAARRARAVDEREVAEVIGEEGGALSLRRRLRWALLAFVPSSLVLGATTYITTDVAAVPLLWVVPLSLYLLSFVLVFAHRRLVPSWLAARMLPGSAVLLALIYLSGATQPAWFLVLFHLLFLFSAALVCHGLLADDRPHAQHLAEFYLWLSAGGAAGGLFNALLAPLLFDSVIEYPLVVVLACYLGPAFRTNWFNVLRLKTRERAGGDEKGEEGEGVERSFARVMWTEAALPLSLFVLAGGLGLLAPRLGLEMVERVALALGLPLFLLNHFGSGRPLRFTLGLAAVMLASTLSGERPARTLHAERNFFGTLRVNANSDDSAHSFQHGSTLHGRQYTDPTRACEPLSYYHRRGPLGTVFEEYGRRRAGGGSGGVAVVGLGAGASAAYAREGEDWTFYEIDPAVVRLAQNPALFTYLTKCAGTQPRVRIGDARLKLRDAPDAGYGLVVLDAFSSDAVPAHLLTREALDLYLSKLAPGGLVVFHTSNRSLELERVAGGLARDAGLVARVYTDTQYDPEDARDPSEWVVVARRAEDLGRLAADARWAPLDETTRKLEVWRDDFSNVAGVIKWQ